MRRIVPALLLAACAGADDPPAEPCTACMLADENNFSYTSDLAIGTLAVPERADATIRWDALTRDIRGDALDPLVDIEEGRLIAFRNLPADEIAWALSHDELDQADVGVYVTCTPADASCALSSFGMFGNAIDIQEYFEEGYGTWLLALGERGAAGADALAFIEPRADATATELVVTDATSRLDVDVDLLSLTPVLVPAFDETLTLDWSALTRDGLGDPLDTSTIDDLWVARFAETPAELERDVFALETMADVAWTMDVSGRQHAALADLEGDSPFLGIDRSGSWVAALRCRTCTNPAPRLLTFLTPAAQ